MVFIASEECMLDLGLPTCISDSAEALKLWWCCEIMALSALYNRPIEIILSVCRNRLARTRRCWRSIAVAVAGWHRCGNVLQGHALGQEGC